MSQITLTPDDLALLKPESVADILNLLRSQAQEHRWADLANPPEYAGIDMDGVVNLTPDQVREFIGGIHEQTIAGLRIFAEHGPIIDARLLEKVGITNFGHFQGRVSKRTRTVSGNPKAYLFGWDSWDWADDETLASGRYAVTPATYKALRQVFGLDG